MEWIFKTLTAIFLGVLLAFSLAAFVSLSSISSVIEEKNINGLVEEVVDAAVEDVVEAEFNDTDFNNIAGNLLEKCKSADRVFFGNEDEEIKIKINCSELEEAGKSEFKELVKEEIKKDIVAKIESLGIESKLKLVKMLSWVFGIASMVLALAISFIVPVISMLIIGVSALSVGAGFIAVEGVKANILLAIKQGLAESGIGTIPGNISSLIDGLASNIHAYLLTTFVIGAVFVFIGLILFIVFSKKKKAEKRGKKKSRK